MNSTANRLHIAIQGLCGCMQPKIWQLSQRCFHGIQWGFIRKSSSVQRSVWTRVRADDRVPDLEEQQKFRGSTKCVDYRAVNKAISLRSHRCLTGPQSRLSPHPNQGRRQVPMTISHPVLAVRVRSHAIQVEKRTIYNTS